MRRRPAAVTLSLFRGTVDRRGRGLAWFGPEGLASLIFALLIVKKAESDTMTGRGRTNRSNSRLEARVSIPAHSSTTVVLPRRPGQDHTRVVGSVAGETCFRPTERLR